ncbi:hypothetical protein OH492_23600 [Vibrio chagasii]|nr:hypothetical protein [Vibrio chagasii]
MGIISEGISLFYQGKGGQPFEIALQLDTIQQQGEIIIWLMPCCRIRNAGYLQAMSRRSLEHALQLAKQAFEMNPRYDIANLTTGLTAVNQPTCQPSFPLRFFYAAESTPSPISFYLLSVAGSLIGQPKRFAIQLSTLREVKKEHQRSTV